VPINADRFEEIDTDEPAPGTNADQILSFLRAHPDKAFTQSEIADETDVKRGSVGPTLVRLRERGRVDHRGTYWRISDHEQTVDAATAHGAETLSDREAETPAFEEWQDHAVDPRDHRNEQ